MGKVKGSTQSLKKKILQPESPIVFQPLKKNVLLGEGLIIRSLKQQGAFVIKEVWRNEREITDFFLKIIKAKVKKLKEEKLKEGPGPSLENPMIIE
ncbi:hypothetical protein DACRYDRAFT_109450 [Dacryopinax primogenitus]|uniref:Uncharacterized protein n=1 Tax=Dacryopinax primogenitus (strain DJM 731) TaxID=1858805 RepID=M5G2D6_DACPD|nr:uncharacterized protein DACRYDRAFT_109450 [Dacryopinax primogenitus]EJU00027.1 hypothetical protein DACRYDRAFT_109450 [Dacryopinax primogenitus]